MTAQHSDAQAVVARFAARHEAEIARSYLADHGIEAFILGDDAHAPLAFADSVRLVVMQREAEEACRRLEEVASISDALAEGADWGEDQFGREPEDIDPKQAKKAGQRRELAVATTACALIVAVLSFIPWRLEHTGELVWSPFYRGPFPHTTLFDAHMQSESAQIAFGIFVLQMLSIIAVGWTTSVLVGTVWSRDRGES